MATRMFTERNRKLRIELKDCTMRKSLDPKIRTYLWGHHQQSDNLVAVKGTQATIQQYMHNFFAMKLLVECTTFLVPKTYFSECVIKTPSLHESVMVMN